MFNDSYWEPHGDKQAFLMDVDEKPIAMVTYNEEKDFWCYVPFREILSQEDDRPYWEGTRSLEEVEWLATTHIYIVCNRIVGDAYRIIDHLPDTARLYGRIKW